MIAQYNTIRADRFSDRKAGHPNLPAAQMVLGTIIGDSIMKRIKLTQGQVALIDDADFEWLNQWKWSVQKNHRRSYAIRSLYEKGKRIATIRMHRLVMDAPKECETDHINHNGLDNRRNNLRLCTHQQNMQNQRGNRNTSSRFRGVYFEKIINKWRAQIRCNGIVYHLGNFDNEIDAAVVYDKKALQLFGEFACLNITKKISLCAG